ncbi:DNA-binding response regulator [Rhizobium sullae]|uniref:DNA-binding response regulator n=1 Tax=Rhizobium sullae TaxID=50338 RepID=A0A2N0D057_RHISU|nr:response regulator [Rhizobium sullae]PKA39504.1 DNA-binding response regulator [Rhizobium sullae]
MNATPVVHVIDDDLDLRLSLETLLRSVGLRTCLYETIPDVSAFASCSGPRCILVDVRLPGFSGLDFQDQLAKTETTIPLIFMTGYGDIPMTVRAMKAGAVDFLPKPFRDQDMLDAVSRALEIDRLKQARDSEVISLKKRYGELSLREKEVMALVTTGLMNKQIAGKLSLSEVTVKIHRGSAVRKMGARSLADLVKMAETLGIHDR